MVKVHRYFEDEAYSYLLMEYCEGGDLHDFQLQQKEKVFSIKQATKILADVIRGLEEIHRKGYVHRDIKLTNIMIRRDSGQEVVIFFNIEIRFGRFWICQKIRRAGSDFCRNQSLHVA